MSDMKLPLQYSEQYGRIEDADGKPIRGEEHARHIVACVNFCGNIPTLELERTDGKAVDMKEEFTKLKQSRDAISLANKAIRAERDQLQSENEALRELVREVVGMDCADESVLMCYATVNIQALQSKARQLLGTEG